jgi:23S rRNA (pseudouridine1915-N3)-methyltransferase
VKLLVRAIGKMRDPRLESVCEEYLGRIRKHLPIEIQEVGPTVALLRHLPDGAEVVALEPGGAAWDSQQFTTYVGERMLRGTKALVFLIGGPDGLARDTVARSHRRLSLSPMTLPHRLARVFLCEQLYRAVATLRNEPYNR